MFQSRRKHGNPQGSTVSTQQEDHRAEEARSTNCQGAGCLKEGWNRFGCQEQSAVRPVPKESAGTEGIGAVRSGGVSAKATRRPAATQTGKPRSSRTPKPKAMEVAYSGRIFRSRLEARWAVFLDLLNVNWDYEPSFYQVSQDLYYLPDFYLPDQQLWLEVKGAPFMDAASMAKVLAAVAGPMRIPLREAPYTPSDRLLLGGPFRPLKRGSIPVHTLVATEGPNLASLSYAAFGIRGDGSIEISTLGQSWDTVPVTGIKAARRPSTARLQMLLDPEPQLHAAVPERLSSAYNGANRLAFDDATKAVCDLNVLAAVARRRSGRPLGAAA